MDNYCEWFCCHPAVNMRSCSPCWVTSSPGAVALCLCMWNAGQAELTAKAALHIKLKNRLASLGRALVLMPELHRQKMMKRSRHPSSSDDSDNGSNSTCWSQHSSQHRRGSGQKPSEVSLFC
ncbi:hypothetical protein XENORESO_002870 [Xenotaenia resolanae]|uniref:Uncharacterized protein n=1 Tax=Xenotaenia resolanae TaxID=208358 RepID=A0ABV0W3M8_9TELE